MSDGECMNPVHSPLHPRFSQNDVKCRVCGGFKWKWASWSKARQNLPILVTAIAAFEKGREVGFREHAELTESALDKMRASTQTTTVCRACKGTGREEERICTLCHGVGEVKVR